MTQPLYKGAPQWLSFSSGGFLFMCINLVSNTAKVPLDVNEMVVYWLLSKVCRNAPNDTYLLQMGGKVAAVSWLCRLFMLTVAECIVPLSICSNTGTWRQGACWMRLNWMRMKQNRSFVDHSHTLLRFPIVFGTKGSQLDSKSVQTRPEFSLRVPEDEMDVGVRRKIVPAENKRALIIICLDGNLVFHNRTVHHLFRDSVELHPDLQPKCSSFIFPNQRMP